MIQRRRLPALFYVRNFRVRFYNINLAVAAHLFNSRFSVRTLTAMPVIPVVFILTPVKPILNRYVCDIFCDI